MNSAQNMLTHLQSMVSVIISNDEVTEAGQPFIMAIDLMAESIEGKLEEAEEHIEAVRVPK